MPTEGLVNDSNFDKRLMAVDFVRSTRNIWFAVFRGLTSAQVSAVLSQVKVDASGDLDDLDFTEKDFIHQTVQGSAASEVTIPVVQFFRRHKPIPGGLMDMVRYRINVLHYSGSVTGDVPEYDAEAADAAAAAAPWSEAGAATPEQDAQGEGDGINYNGNDELPDNPE